MHVCPKCGDYHADRLLAFCLADGTPLVDVDPSSDAWSEGVRVIDRKAFEVRAQNRKLKWRRVMLRAMLMTTMVVSVAAVVRSFSVTVEKPGDLCIGTFNDLNGDGVQQASEPGLPGFVFQVLGTGPAKTVKTDLKEVACSDFPVGEYTVVEQPQRGWIATTPTTQTATVTAGQTTKVSFGSRQEGELCITKFDDLNGNGVREPIEPGLSGFVFQVSGTGPATTPTTGPNGEVCSALPLGTYTVVEQPQSGWIAATPTTQTVTITAGQAANVVFGNRQERGELCIRKFNDLNGNGVRERIDLGLSGFVFQVSGTGPTTTLTTGSKGEVCSALPVGTYTVVEQTQRGWTATTPTTQTVTITAGQSAKMLFGNSQEKGELCIRKFNDLNDNGVQDAGEPGLSGFVFQVRGTGPATRLTTGPQGDVCSAFPVGAYIVVEQPQRGWVATTATTQTVTLSAKRAANLSFGNKRPKPDTECFEADNRREWQIIRARYDARWGRIIEGERERIIAENVPAGTAPAKASLGPIEYESLFRRCTLVMVTARYEWLVQSPKERKKVRGQRTFVCEKMGGGWFCR